MLVEKIIDKATTERNMGELFWGDLTDEEREALTAMLNEVSAARQG